MRINQFIAQATGISRRAADRAIELGQITINQKTAHKGQTVSPNDTITLNGTVIRMRNTVTILLNKPAGFVCSRNGQGSKTIYDLLPLTYHHLKPVGRLDKDSSGLLLLTNDGNLANSLTHPSFNKTKVYNITLDTLLADRDKTGIETGIVLDDGISKLQLDGNGRSWTVTMQEGRNRQIRRTFGALGYKVVTLHRTQFGPIKLDNLKEGKHTQIDI